MPLPVVALFPWLVGLFASTIGAVFSWFAGWFALRLAARLALVTAYVIAVAAITAGVALTVKALIMGIQVAMPLSLGAATFFLPNNINLIMGCYFSMRVTYFLFMWTRDRLTAYIRVTGAT